MKSFSSDVSLALHTTFRIGGNAKYFFTIDSTQQLAEAVMFAREKNVPWFVLGEGSNLLVADTGFDGVVIKMNNKGIEWNEREDDRVEVVMSAGEHWDDVVATTVERGLSGFENLSGIPGTVGAAPVQNIGAYGKEIKDTLTWVEVFDTELLTLRILPAAQCAFAYRDSIFKSPAGKKYIITRVACVLKHNGVPDISYKDLRNFFEGKVAPSIGEVRDAVLSIRKAKLPDLSIYGTAGSFFKNPIISVDEYKKLAETYPNIPAFDVRNEAGDIVADQKKISAAWILDNVCNFKGHRRTNVGVYQNQSLVLVHFGNGTAKEIDELAHDMSECVKKNTHIILAREVVMLGFKK